MKVCSICGENKTDNDFYYRDRRLGKFHSQCKSCYARRRREIWRDHYQKYGSDYRERAVERNRRLKIRRRMQMLEYLEGKSCVICGIDDNRVLEFDHINPDEKSFGIAQGIHAIFTWPKILAEIEKCQILCANCHKIKTATQQGWYKNI